MKNYHFRLFQSFISKKFKYVDSFVELLRIVFTQQAIQFPYCKNIRNFVNNENNLKEQWKKITCFTNGNFVLNQKFVGRSQSISQFFIVKGKIRQISTNFTSSYQLQKRFQFRITIESSTSPITSSYCAQLFLFLSTTPRKTYVSLQKKYFIRFSTEELVFYFTNIKLLFSTLS